MTSSNAARTTATTVDSARKLALAGGVAYLMTSVFSIPTAFLYGPVLGDPAYIGG